MLQKRPISPRWKSGKIDPDPDPDHDLFQNRIDSSLTRVTFTHQISSKLRSTTL